MALLKAFDDKFKFTNDLVEAGDGAGEVREEVGDAVGEGGGGVDDGALGAFEALDAADDEGGVDGVEVVRGRDAWGGGAAESRTPGSAGVAVG